MTKKIDLYGFYNQKVEASVEIKTIIGDNLGGAELTFRTWMPTNRVQQLNYHCNILSRRGTEICESYFIE